MQIPSYTITNLMVDYLIKYEVALEKIKSTPLPYTHKAELEAKLQAEDIHNLSELVSYQIGFDQAEKVQQGKVLPSSRERLMIFTNYRSAMEFARSYNKDHFVPPSSELLSHINSLLMRKILEEWECGKIRSFSEIPNEIYDNWYGLRDYYPELHVSSYFDQLFGWILRKDDKTHKLIKLGVLLFEMIDKAPLIGGNEITAITTLSILSKELGYNPNCDFSFNKALNFIQSDFASAFKIAKGDRDLTVFLEAFLYSISLEILSLENIYSTTFNQKVKQQGKLVKKFNSRQIRVIEYLGNIDKITRSQYRKMMGISFMTAYRDLQDLVEKDYVVANGVGRGTYYSLAHSNETEESVDKKPRLEVYGSKE